MTVLDIRNVSVDFPTVRVPSLKEWAIRRVRGDLRQDYFHALRDVSVSVEPGRCLGIIGRNGAGKSTLLRVAAGVIRPSAGEAIVRGTVAPLIELGTGFDAELTGRENIFFNAALLGRSRASVRSRLDEIIDFSGLEAFIDAPLRTYSTGMVARLAFSIATTVDAELILLDEILSVGDASFQQRCEERILGFFRSGCTIVLVSHDLGSVRRLCTEILWLHDGCVRAYGSDDSVIDAYESEAGAHAVAIPVREGDAAEAPVSTTASSSRSRSTTSRRIDDVTIVVPPPAGDRVLDTLLEQRLRTLFDARLIAADDAALVDTVKDRANVLVITDRRLVPSRALVDGLRTALENAPECIAAVPVTNLSDEPAQCVPLGRAYLTQRQFEEGTEWLSRRPADPLVIEWRNADPGAVLAHSDGFVSAGADLGAMLAGRKVVVERTAYVHRFPRVHSLQRQDLALRIGEAASVLDLFCGDGVIAASLKASRKCRVVGIEPERDAAREARRHCDFVHDGSPEDVLEGMSETFDVIVAGERFVEVAEPIRLLRQLGRVCRPDGRLLLSVPNVGAWPVVSDLLAGRFDYAYMGNPLAGGKRYYTAHSIEQVLATAGWDLTSLEPQEQAQTAESRRLLDSLDAGSVPHVRDQLLAAAFYVTASPRR